ncbi:Tail Collar domain protein [Sulfuricurvum kujiense DSM 16994]|uniref:Tail Collar domain protein n=1 Tax=Sulfuricurvum kujiense (strain ATCC BAA-921 / DSM 16994 / JCM 11577 / YK-1) TaxID=709032 RepID=E4U0G2_SULKY|nr:tail fiber protein [Sulfuricurvum kujiense]ADR33259.1 Tail Collar domain protein [Sulfuricurvum kujiense DSM 16994]
MKKYYLSALAALSFASSVFAGNPDDYFGAIWPTAAQYCPIDTVEADGTIYPVSQYQALAALYGNTYGGDGRTTFGVPNLRGKMPIGTGPLPGTSYTIQRGDKVGQETSTLTQSTFHTHIATFTRSSSTNPITVNIPVSANTNGNLPAPDSTHNTMAGTSGGPGGAAMWANTMTNPVNINGVTTSGGTGTGTVSVGITGTAAPTAVTTIPPQLGVRFCITTSGTWPENPND